MFELYFGAFDIVLYSVAFVIAMYVADEICTRAEQAQPVLSIATPCPITVTATSEKQPVPASTITHQPVCAETSAATTVMTAAPQALESTTPVTATEEKPQLRLADIRLYKLHKKSVVKVSALPFSIPDAIKRYVLHGEPVVRLSALEDVAVIA